MKGILAAVLKLNEYMQVVSGAALTFIVLLTTVDVILRAFGHPITGTYEVVAMCGGIVIGFVAPITAWLRGHVYVDFLVKKFSRRVQNVVNVITRCVGIGMFTLVGSNVVKIGNNFRRADEISNSLQLPLYPIAYAVALSFFVLAAVLICDILKISGGTYE
jgi:TRAP-type C4-dicarboxylate transport system permease small subunit